MVERLLTLKEVSEYLNTHKMTVYRLAQRRKIPASKVGRVWRFKRQKIDQWLDKQANSRKKKRRKRGREKFMGTLVTSNYVEKRKSPRATVKIPLRVRHAGSTSPTLNAKTVDLSEGGVRLSLPDNLKLPKNPILEFTLPQALEDFRIYTDIVWSDGPHYGLRFKDLERKQAANLKRILWHSENYIEKNIADLLDKASPVMRSKIRSFFITDVRAYLDQISSLCVRMERQKLDKRVGQEKFNVKTNDIAKRGDGLEQALDHKLLTKEIKHRFRSVIDSWVTESELYKRGIEKPRGYPGDYLLLEKIYDNRPESRGVGYYYDRHFLNNSYAGSVRKRKDKMVEILGDFIKNANLPSVKILNLASGSCREIKELFEKLIQVKGTVKIACIDHDEEALKYSQKTLNNLPKNVQVVFMKENVITMPERQTDFTESLGRQDLIYSLGLIDYVPDRILKNMLKFWFGLLAPEGRLILTHKDRDRDPQAPLVPDWFCDWKFIPRNEEHLVSLVKDSIKNAHFKLERDATGKIIFLSVDNIAVLAK